MTTKFIEEVNQQPDALRNLISFYQKDGGKLLHLWQDHLNKYSNIIFCGMGTSEHAGFLVQDALVKAGKTVSIYDAGEYLH